MHDIVPSRIPEQRESQSGQVGVGLLDGSRRDVVARARCLRSLQLSALLTLRLDEPLLKRPCTTTLLRLTFRVTRMMTSAVRGLDSRVFGTPLNIFFE